MADVDLPGPRTGILARKVAGVPVLYLGLGAVVILAVVAWKMKPAVPASAEDLTGVDAEAEAMPGTGVDGDGTAYDGFNANPAPAYAQGIISPTTTVDTNVAWVKRGTEWSVANLGASGGNAQLALSKYIDGDQLTYSEGQIRDAVIKQFGAPPESVTPGGTSSKPVDASKAPATRQGNPPVRHVVKGKNDNSLYLLCKLYYRSDNITDEMIDFLQGANSHLPGAGPYAPGVTINVPAYANPKYFTSTKATDTLNEIAAKNGTTPRAIIHYNDGMKFPVKAGTRVRVG